VGQFEAVKEIGEVSGHVANDLIHLDEYPAQLGQQRGSFRFNFCFASGDLRLFQT